MIRAGIAGATGYTGLELVRLLDRHPNTEVAWLTSENSAGRLYSDVVHGPWPIELIPLADALGRTDEVDVVFLALPHAQSVEPVRAFHAAGATVVDLSADYRLTDTEVYARWYGIQHAAPDLVDKAVYGLCEAYREQIRGATLIANPGCYPTSVNLALLPLARAGWLPPRVIVDSMSGVSGAGRTPKLPYHYVEANENLTPYNAGRRHRHLAEMEQVLGEAAGRFPPSHITFVPHLTPLSQGILSTIHVSLEPGCTEAAVRAQMEACWGGEPFVQLLPPDAFASVRHTSHTNRCAISVTAVEPDDPDCTDLVIVSSIDNLIKGASGQAVQNMNIALDLPETAGLL